MPLSRDSSRGSVAVEDVASGAALFDGNDSNVVSWLFANEQFKPDNMDSMFEQLMFFTMNGHLAWVVFPPEGFRV